MDNLGNSLYRITYGGRASLFEQGEIAELTYGAFNIAVTSLQEYQEEEVNVSYPVGWRPDNKPISSTRSYRKSELIERYQSLAFHHLAVNGLIQIVRITEAMLVDVVRAVVMKYPKKLGTKRTLPMKVILEATSIEDVHLRAMDALLNELSYKSSTEFAETVESLLSLNLLECPAFHRYLEIKATRDILIHNAGVANETYVRKAATHARVRSGATLPVDLQYFLHSYEACIQLTEWLEKELHERWHSSELEAAQNRQLELQLEPLPALPPTVPVLEPGTHPARNVPAIEPLVEFQSSPKVEAQ